LFAPMPHSLRLRCEEVGTVTANVGRAGKAAALAPARTARPCGRRAAQAGKTQAKGQTAPSIRTRRAKQPAKRSVSRACLPRWCEPCADSRQCQRRGSRQASRLPTWRCRHEEWTIARTPRLLELSLTSGKFLPRCRDRGSFVWFVRPRRKNFLPRLSTGGRAIGDQT
jgi:hypothetical protein